MPDPVPTHAPFRWATDAALALAVVALGYVEYPLLPEAGWLAAGVAVGIGVIARAEGRVRFLSIADANKLGAAVGAGWLVWAGVRIARESRAAEFTGLGWPQFLVSLLGPLLTAAIPAMLLRRDKTAADYWQIYAAGLAAAVLAGAMTDDPAAVALLAAAGVFGVGGLAHFAAARAGEGVATGRHPARVGVLPVLLWAGLVAAAAVPLYLVTPRSAFARFVFVKERVEVGYAADQMVDLNRTGELRANPEEAFHVRAEAADGSPVTTLDPNQRWRGAVLTHYKDGAWRRDQIALLPAVAFRAKQVGGGEWRPPPLGPGRYRLGFRVPARLRSEFLAEPVVWAPDEPPPVADLHDDGRAADPWYVLGDGSFSRMSTTRPKADTIRYVQFTRPTPDPDLGTGFVLDGDQLIDRVYRTNEARLRRVKEYADEALRAAVRNGRLPAAAIRPMDVTRLPAEEHHEALARELAVQLAADRSLRYTTKLRRENRGVDPVEDFLFHSKAGHCERFASALVVLLRSQGIPAALVLGFKGCDPGAAAGDYVVRQSHAHAWAEALISRPDGRGGRVWHWLSLDPSPLQDADDTTAVTEGGLFDLGRAAFERFVGNYTAERRDQALRAVSAALNRPAVWVGGGLLLLAAALVVRRLRRPPPPPPPGGGYGRLLAVLARHGLAPAAGETPREFAARAAAELPPAFADLPPEWAGRHYRERFGGQPTPDADRDALDARLADLDAALRGRRG